DTLVGQGNNYGATLLAPDNSVVFSVNGTVDSGVYQLPSSGTYTLQLTATTDGPYGFRLLNLATDSTPLTIGATNAAPIDLPYRTDVYRFDATPGQRFLYDPLNQDSSQTVASLVTSSLGLFNAIPGQSDGGLYTAQQPGT